MDIRLLVDMWVIFIIDLHQDIIVVQINFFNIAELHSSITILAGLHSDISSNHDKHSLVATASLFNSFRYGPKQLADSLPLINKLFRVLFATSFLIVRATIWQLVSAVFWWDAIKDLSNPDGTYTLYLGFLLLANTFLGVLQLTWAGRILAELRALINGKKVQKSTWAVNALWFRERKFKSSQSSIEKVLALHKEIKLKFVKTQNVSTFQQNPH